MKELLHDDDVREEGREVGRAEGREVGRAEGRAEGENQFVMLITRMNAGGDTDKVSRLGEPKVLRAMKEKYGIK